jgi:hypothetical protein
VAASRSGPESGPIYRSSWDSDLLFDHKIGLSMSLCLRSSERVKPLLPRQACSSTFLSNLSLPNLRNYLSAARNLIFDRDYLEMLKFEPVTQTYANSTIVSGNPIKSKGHGFPTPR